MKKIGKCLIALLFIFALFCGGISVLTACSDNNVVLESISVTKKPSKTVYVVNESFVQTGMEVTAGYSDGTERLLGQDEYTCSVPKFGVPTGKFETSQTVTVSYTEGEIVKSTEFSVTVTNKVTSVEILSGPDKTEYYPGEYFNPAGLKIKAVFQNGSQSEIEIGESNAAFSVTEISAGTECVTVTYGGYGFTIDIAVKNGIYIEAETGLLNGKPVSDDNARTLSYETVKGLVLQLYESHLKVAYGKKLGEIKKAELIASGVKDVESKLSEYYDSEEYKTALENYTATNEFKELSEAYKSGTNSDIGEWNYIRDLARYKAHGDSYVGELKKNDEISFVFEADKAGTGSIAFRLASTYLIRDNGEWLPIEMGAVRFDKVCEFYVNGVKADVSSGGEIAGGKTEDGSPNEILWTNWNEVKFNGVSFVEGRNVIRLRMLEHNLVSPAQKDNKAIPNIDSLIISADGDAVISGYDNSAEFSYKVNSIALEKSEDKVELKVEGDISVNTGYIEDLFNIKLGAVDMSVDVAGGKFTAYADVSALTANADGYALTILGKTVEAGDIDITSGTVSAYKDYRLDTQNFVKLIVEDNTHGVRLDSAEIANPEVTLGLRDGKPHIIIGGGVYSATVQGFDLTVPEDVRQIRLEIASAVKDLYLFDVQLFGEPYNTVIPDGTHTVNVLDDNKFEIVCDISKLGIDNGYGVHFNKKGYGKDNDFNSQNFPNFKELKLISLTEGSTKYEIFYNDKDSGHSFDWDTLAVFVSDIHGYNNENISLEKSADGKIYAVISGKYEAYTKEEMEAELLKIKADYRYDEALGNITNITVPLAGKITSQVFEGENGGTYTIKLDISDARDGKIFFHLDFNEGKTNFVCKLTDDEIKRQVETSSYRYKLYTTSGTGSVGGWADGLVAVEIVNLQTPSYGTAEIEGFEKVGDRVYLVISGSYVNHTAESLKSLITSLTFQKSDDLDGEEVCASLDNVTVTVDDGKYFIRYDITELEIREAGNGYLVHLSPFGSGEYSDVNVPVDGNVSEVILNGVSYSYTEYNFGTWSRKILTKTDLHSFVNESVALGNTDGEAYLVISGSYAYYTRDWVDAQLEKIKADYMYHKALGNADEKTVILDANDIKTNVAEGADGGTFTIGLKLKDNTAGTVFFHFDYTDGKTNLICKLTDDESKIQTETDNRTFTLSLYDGGEEWTNGLVAVTIVLKNAAYGEVRLVGFESSDGKVYAVYSGDCTAYSADDIKNMITLSEFENSTDSYHKVQADLTKAVISVENEKYILKFDISDLIVVDDKDGRNGGYFTHIKPFGNGDNGDVFNAENVNALTVGGFSYSAETCNIYGWTGSIIKIKDVRVFSGTEKAEFVTDNGKIYYQTTFATQNMQKDDVVNKISKIDLESTSGGRIDYIGDALIFGEMDSNGKITVRIDISAVGAGVYVPHFFTDNETSGKNICDNAPVTATVFGGKSYEVKETNVEAWNWTAYLINITEITE